MIKSIKDIFSDETEIIDPQDLEFADKQDEIDETFQVEQEVKPSINRSIVKIYEPVTQNATSKIIDSIKRGEMCIVSFSKVSEEDSKVIYSTLSGSMYSLDGQMKMIESDIIICAPKNFLIDGETEK